MRITTHPPFFRRAVRKVATVLLSWAENRNDARMARNGEAWLLGALVATWAREDRTVSRVVIDVGANRGDFTQAILAAADAADVRVVVYACEPNPSAVPHLVARFAEEPRVRMVRAAVSDFEGTAALFDSTAASELASLVKRDRHRKEDPPQVAVTTLAALFALHGIERIDFLKLDIEGSELEALRGLDDRLRPTIIRAMLFEYGGTTLDAGHRLRDFYDLLTSRGYHVAKLFPEWIEVRSYQAQWDNFYYSNWVAFAPEAFETPWA